MGMNTKVLKKYLANSLSDLAHALEKKPKTNNTDQVVLEILKSEYQGHDDLIQCISKVSEELSIITEEESIKQVNLNSIYGDDDFSSCKILEGLSNVVRKAENMDDSKQSVFMRYIYQTLKELDKSQYQEDTSRALKEMMIVNSLLG